jgi:hypothetical protein
VRSLGWRQWLLVLLTLGAMVAAFLVSPVQQDPAYHLFVDQRALFGLPNFWNVFSNIGYLAVGIFAFVRLGRVRTPILRWPYLTFCIAVTLVAFGSAWYHYEPSNASLVWDRLPMAPGFMALFVVVLGERVSWRLAQQLLWPLVIIGVGSVLYWAWSESRGAGDLRPYALVQFLPVALMPLLLLLFPGNARSARWLWWTFAGYVAAKLAEYFDVPIYQALGLSGHSVKHFVSSVAVLFAVFAMLVMKAPGPISEPDPKKARNAPWKWAGRGRRH